MGEESADAVLHTVSLFSRPAEFYHYVADSTGLAENSIYFHTVLKDRKA